MSSSSSRPLIRSLLAGSMKARMPIVRSLIGWSAIQAIPALLSGRLVAQAIDHGFLAHSTRVGLLWLVALAASLLVGAWGRRRAYQRLASLTEPFRDELVTTAVRGALRDCASGSRSDTGSVARLTRHIEIAREAYASVFMVAQAFVVSAVSALLGLFSLMPAVLVFVLPPLLGGLVVFVVALKRTASQRRLSLLVEERIAEATGEFVDGLRDIVASGAEDIASTRADEEIRRQAIATVQVARFTAVQTGAIALGGWLPVVLILAGGSWLRSNGATIGVILGALTYVLRGVQPALEALIRGVGSNGLWLLVTLERIVEAIGTDAGVSASRGGDGSRRSAVSGEPDQGNGSARVSSAEVPGVTLSDVSFGYGPEPVIHGLNLNIPPGDHLAVVGPSGVGKSTLANLMAGLLEPQAGRITIGGKPVSELDHVVLTSTRSLIPQEAYVFVGTLWDNLVYLRPDAGESEVEAAAAAVGMTPLVERVGGYRAELAPRALSAGERQLVTLARAYLSPARLFILDEATCHLDPISEARVENAFARRGGTVVVVAHRISSARRAKRILVMDGVRAAVGTHESLVLESKLYRDLVGHWTAGDLAEPDPSVTNGHLPGRTNGAGSPLGNGKHAGDLRSKPLRARPG
ncbi:MAG TPA: ABC transporter ATP-binding protein [Acidimicrobiales bacterium]